MVKQRCITILISVLILGATYGKDPLYTNTMTEAQIKSALNAKGWLYADINTLCGLVSNGGSMDWNNWDMRDATLLYAKLYDVNDNYQYAVKAAKLLKEFADHMPNWMLYQKNTTTPQTGPFEASSNAAGLWGKTPDGLWWGGSCIFYDCLSYGGGPLAEAYYYIYGSNAMQNLGYLNAIKTDVLRRHLNIQYLRGLTNLNYAGDQMEGILHFEYALNNSTDIAKAMHDCVWNVKAMYKVKFFADGWWCEGTCGYHNMIHGNLLSDVINAFMQGYSDPLGYVDAGDGTRYDNLDLLSELSGPIGRANWIRQSAIQPNPNSVNYEEHFVIGDTWFNTTAWYSTKMTKADSLLYGCMGHGVLGTGSKIGSDIRSLTQASIHFGQMNIHEHRDTLTLTLFAKGKEIMSEGEYKPDPNKITDPNADRNWNSSTAGHITVVINNKDQPGRLESDALKRVKEPADEVPGIPDWEMRWNGQGDNMQEGRLKTFVTDFKNVQVMEVDGQKAYGKRIDGKLMDRYRRMIALVKIDDHNSYVVDIFRVKGGSIHDYMLHSCLEFPYTMQIYDSAGIPKTLNKYWTDPMHTYIHNTYYCSARYDWSVAATLNDNSAAVKSFVLGINDSANMYVIKGVAQAMRRNGDAEFLLLRHYNFSGEPVSTFVAVHHPYIPATGPLVTNVQGVSLNTTDANAVGLRVTLSGGRTDTILNTISDSYAQIQTSDGAVTLNGKFAHVATGGTGNKWAYMAEGTYLNVSGKILMAEGSYQGTLTGTYRKDAGHSSDAFITDTILPTDGSLNNRYLIVDEGGIVVQTFKINKVERINNQTIIYSLDEPGITITPGLIKQEYYPCWGISGTAKFKICDSIYTNLETVRNANTSIKYSTIQAAINAASAGHTIEVSDGVYYENIDFLGKNLILKSLNPTEPNTVENTIISGMGTSPTVTFDGGENSSCNINGFTIVNGKNSGILCLNSSPVISNCYVALTDGNGISLTNSNAKINNCLIIGNTKDGIETKGGTGVEITNCTIAENLLYGVHYPTGAVSGDKIINSIIWNNDGPAQISSSPLVQYSDVKGGFSGLGNINADPCFVTKGVWARCWEKSVNLGAVNVENGLRLITTVGDGDTEPVTVSRIEGRRTIDAGNDYYMYFDINDSVVYQGSSKDWYIQIYYYDTEGGLIGLQYDSDTGSDVNARYKLAGTITIGNTDTWKSYTFHVNDAYFGNRQNGGADFRVCKFNGGRLYLDMVYVRNYTGQPFSNTWLSGNYNLKSTSGWWEAQLGRWVNSSVTSLCIDAGNPGYSLGTEPASPNNVRINMGNYGGGLRASKTPSNWRALSDVTNDGKVDFKDVGIYCEYWLENSSNLPVDFNRNTEIDFRDFASIRKRWNWKASWY